MKYQLIHAIINEKFLEINFNDGVKSKLNIDKLVLEFSNLGYGYKIHPQNKMEFNFRNI